MALDHAQPYPRPGTANVMPDHRPRRAVKQAARRADSRPGKRAAGCGPRHPGRAAAHQRGRQYQPPGQTAAQPSRCPAPCPPAAHMSIMPRTAASWSAARAGRERPGSQQRGPRNRRRDIRRMLPPSRSSIDPEQGTGRARHCSRARRWPSPAWLVRSARRLSARVGGYARALSPTGGHAPTQVPGAHAQALWTFGDADLT